MDRRNSLALAAGMLAALAGCDGAGEDPADTITYYQTVKPILDARCVQCHVEGGIAPFSLSTYERAATFAAASVAAVEDGVMPPWKANDDCNDYSNSRALTEAEKRALRAWVDGGKLEGDAANPAPPLDIDAPGLSRVDMTLTMPEGYTPAPPSGATDDYRCFLLPWPETETAYVTGFRAVPGNASIVHHVVAFVAAPQQAEQYQALDDAEPGPGYTCFGGPGGQVTQLTDVPQWLGAWAPGSGGHDLPDGLGQAIAPGSVVILQMHYNTMNAVGEQLAPDTSRLELRIESQVTRVARMQPWASPLWILGDGMRIPANDPDVVHSFEYDLTLAPGVSATEVDFYSATMHMHLLGRSGRASIERADGSSECLVQIDDWDFKWQDGFWLRAPATFYRGDKLRIECRWDNTLANQPVVGGQVQQPRDVSWGEDSTDEMCLGVFLIAERR